MLEQQLMNIMKRKRSFIEDLCFVRELHLPQCYISAGYIRNYCWDYLHQYETETPLNDIDIIYYDPGDLTYDMEIEMEAKLNEWKPNFEWSVKNQARMHLTNGTPPYESTLDAMTYWPETATAVGMRIDDMQTISIIAPYGLDDLFQLNIRRTDRFRDRQYYLSRIASKAWFEKWPQLRLIEQ